MGPDSGTGVISGVPLAFTNVSTPGNIGIVEHLVRVFKSPLQLINELGGGLFMQLVLET